MLAEHRGGILYPRYKLNGAFLEEIPFESDVIKDKENYGKDASEANGINL